MLVRVDVIAPAAPGAAGGGRTWPSSSTGAATTLGALRRRRSRAWAAAIASWWSTRRARISSCRRCRRRTGRSSSPPSSVASRLRPRDRADVPRARLDRAGRPLARGTGAGVLVLGDGRRDARTRKLQQGLGDELVPLASSVTTRRGRRPRRPSPGRRGVPPGLGQSRVPRRRPRLRRDARAVARSRGVRRRRAVEAGGRRARARRRARGRRAHRGRSRDDPGVDRRARSSRCTSPPASATWRAAASGAR